MDVNAEKTLPRTEERNKEKNVEIIPGPATTISSRRIASNVAAGKTQEEERDSDKDMFADSDEEFVPPEVPEIASSTSK